MNTEKYMPPKDEDQFLITLNSNKKLKKSLRQFIIFKSNRQIFINAELLGTSGMLCYLCDGVPLIRYDNKKSPYFIDSQWVIDEKIQGESFCKELKRIVEELREREEIWQHQIEDHVEY